MQSCLINWRNVPTVDSHSIKERSMHLELHRLNRDLRTARTSFSSPFVGFLRKTWERNGRKEATSPSGSTGISNHARPLGSALQRSKGRSYENREGKSEKHERGGERGAHLHAEPQSDCGAHRQLTRFVPSFLKRRHWDSAWKVKTDFSRSPVAPMATRATNFSSTFTPFFLRLAGARLSYYLKFQPSPALFPFPHRRVASLLPNNTLFPLATPTSESLLHSLNSSCL